MIFKKYVFEDGYICGAAFSEADLLHHIRVHGEVVECKELDLMIQPKEEEDGVHKHTHMQGLREH